MIQQIWLTPAGPALAQLILRFYWDDQEQPSVECPLGDFFASGWGGRLERDAQITSLPVCVNPGSALNCFWEMPFRSRCRVTMENRSAAQARIYYQINYALDEVPADAAYFHAQFRRSNPLAYRAEYTILDQVSGRGHYVGTSIAWGVNNAGWWGEGEIKFFLDGDGAVPDHRQHRDRGLFPAAPTTSGSTSATRRSPRPTPACRWPILPDGSDPNLTQSRFSMYRWHLTDPIRFGTDLRVTMQALGWRSGRRYLPLQDDIASVAYWYQTLPPGRSPRCRTRTDWRSSSHAAGTPSHSTDQRRGRAGAGVRGHRVAGAQRGPQG